MPGSTQERSDQSAPGVEGGNEHYRGNDSTIHACLHSSLVMKIIRFLDPNDKIRFAALNEDGGAQRIIEGDADEWTVTEIEAEIEKILSPVDARLILGIGMNYRGHLEELGRTAPKYPVLFMKSPSTVVGNGAPIILPRKLRSDKVDYEGELAVIIGRVARNVSKENALNYVLGYTCANDVSARDWQWDWNSGQFCRGKTFDTFCPLGPCLVTTDEIEDPHMLQVQTRLNGQLVQDGNTEDMLFDIPSLIEFLSGSCTLLPGTVILTGTPEGVGAGMDPPRYLKPKDKVSIEIEAIGELSNTVVEEVL